MLLNQLSFGVHSEDPVQRDSYLLIRVHVLHVHIPFGQLQGHKVTHCDCRLHEIKLNEKANQTNRL